MMQPFNRMIASVRAWFFITAFVASGLLLSLWLYLFLDDRHQRQVQSEFEGLATQYMQVLDNHVQRSLEVLYGLSAFLRQPHNREYEVFQDYVRGSMERLPEVQALEWIPVVAKHRREDYEHRARLQGLTNYRIMEFDGAGRLREAQPREHYYPVYFAYPKDANVEAIGLDLASQPDRKQAIETSIRSRDIVATSPVRLAQEKVEAVYGILIFAPVYANAGQPKNQAGEVEGFALVVYRSIDLLATVFSGMVDKGVAVTVTDVERPSTVLFSNAHQGTALAETNVQDTHRDYVIGKRQWRVTFSPSASYLDGKTQFGVFAYPLTSALLVLSFGLYSALRNRYLFEVEREVRNRTQELTDEVITRREAQGQALLAEKMYRSMFENAIDGIFQTTREGTYIKANSALARIYGYENPTSFIEQMRNIEKQLYVDPNRRAQFVEIMQRDGKVSDFVSEVYRADGSRIFILEKAISVHDENGEFLHYEGNVQEITDRIEAEKALHKANEWLEERVAQRTAELATANRELREEVNIRKAAEREAAAANAAKTQFLAGVSHEIRTPLNAIIGYSQILQQQTNIADKQQLAIRTISQSGNHLLTLIDDILDLSKIEAGMVELSSIDFDLSALITNVAYLVRRKCDDKGLRLKVEGLGHKPVWVRGDDGKLRQILINLLSNAVKYTSCGEIILRVVPEDAWQYRFEVIDTGPGIPERDLPHIFDQFFQRSGWQEGSGLGLSIASRIAKAMHSKIQVRSSSGLGSNFFFHLTFESTQHVPDDAEIPEAEHILLRPGQRCLALVVDDIQHNRDILQQMLDAIGCDVLAVDSGAKALEYVAMQEPSIIFMDILMPELDGIETREKMLTLCPQLRSAFVAFSASAYDEQRQHYLEAGFHEVLSKPVRVDKLHICLRHLLPALFEDGVAPEHDQAPTSIRIPAELADSLAGAARVYNVTRIRHLLDELANLSPTHAEVARRWQALATQHHLDALMQEIAHIRSHDKQAAAES